MYWTVSLRHRVKPLAAQTKIPPQGAVMHGYAHTSALLNRGFSDLKLIELIFLVFESSYPTIHNVLSLNC